MSKTTTIPPWAWPWAAAGDGATVVVSAIATQAAIVTKLVRTIFLILLDQSLANIRVGSGLHRLRIRSWVILRPLGLSDKQLSCQCSRGSIHLQIFSKPRG
jgi:hypothetical protein